MSADLDPRDELTDRLAALGRRPVDPALQSEHLTAIAGVRGGSAFRTSLAGRLKVAAGVMAGFLVGATGLTTAGAMGPLQPVAAKAVEAVAPVDVPRGKADQVKAKAAGKAKVAHDVDGQGSIGTARDWSDGCVAGADGRFAGNRGQYLKQERAKGPEAFAAAKASTCGKPLADDEAPEAPEVESTDDAAEGTGRNRVGNGDSARAGAADDAGKPAGTGRPADAGKPADAGRPADAGKPADTGARPETVPAPPAQEKADDDARLPTAGAPGAAADEGRGDEAGEGDDRDV